MCYACYEDYGKPTLVTPEIQEAARLIDKVYEFSGVGGHLHIILDDWNLGVDSLDFCDRNIAAGRDEVSPEQIKAEEECLSALWKLSVQHRAAALAIHEGFLTPSPPWTPTTPRT